MNRIIICFSAAYCVFGEVATSANLRGRGEHLDSSTHITGSELLLNQNDNLKNHENSMHEMLRKIRKEGLEKGIKVSKDTVLSVPDVSYQNYIVERRRINNDCNGPVASLFARNVGCAPNGPGYSYQTVCTTSTEYGTYYYSTDNCTGPVYHYYSNSFGTEPCYQGVGWQCLAHDALPEFAEKEGLNTYKFRNRDMCNSFASSVLGFWPQYTDDEVLLDDTYFYFPEGNFDDDNHMPCCMPNEMAPVMSASDACPYPQCETSQEEPGEGGEGGEGGGTIERRQLGAKANKATKASTTTTAAAKVPISTFVRPAQWWKSKSKTAAVKSALKLQTVPSDAYFREYSLAQQRSNVCVFDEKYKLWVKTSCHGQRDTLVYHIYADDQCHTLIKKVEHQLSEVVPHYGMCAPSAKTDGRVALTVCQNKDGVAPPGGYGGGDY